MVIVVTGMVGLDKKSYLQKFCELAGRRNKDVLLCSVGDMMYAEAPDVPPGKILDISLKRLHQLRYSVFKDIIAKAKTATNLIVNTHATFRWRHGLFPAVDFDQMRQLAADMYICLIDGVTSLHHRLSDEHSIVHTLKDLIVWREEEIIATEMLCKGIGENIPFYCLARGCETETIDAFYNLLFEPDIKKTYLSFPMTHIDHNNSSVGGQIKNFRKTMKDFFTCFDPADLEESDLPMRASRAQNRGRTTIEVPAAGRKVTLEIEQIRQIERNINSQIYARDFMLIDQADMIVSLIPVSEDGRALLSSGVERELQHAHEAAKSVYIIWPAKKPPSVFVTQTATRVFGGIEAAIRYFQKKGYIKK